MFDDHEAFLAQIEANPLDASALSVYADWLEEVGDDRAAYLRGQTELRRSPTPELKKRLRELYPAENIPWVARLEQCGALDANLTEFLRSCLIEHGRGCGTRRRRERTTMCASGWNSFARRKNGAISYPRRSNVSLANGIWQRSTHHPLGPTPAVQQRKVSIGESRESCWRRFTSIRMCGA